MYSETTADISVIVEPEFLSEQSNSEENFYLYAYRITIENNSQDSCKLIKRHWIIRDGIGREEHVEGNGVIGKQPTIEPGETFTYTSGCPLSTPTGNMRGSYTMQTLHKKVNIKVPLFFLRPARSSSY